MFLNEDLIEAIETAPETVVRLVDGRSYVLADPPEELIERARRYRASVLVTVEEMKDGHEADVFVLRGEGCSEGGADGR
jgi:uncharacterized protein YlzI (FlbEa/FlbD family)